MENAEESTDALVAYEDKPPAWLPRAHNSADVGPSVVCVLARCTLKSMPRLRRL
jgi:hypothetical protein